MKVVSIVGLPGAGKSEVSRVFEENGFVRVRFGDLTDLEMKKRGLEANEANERRTRELLRREHGMAAYALLSLPRIDAALAGDNVVVDGLYSWEEFLLLRERYGQDFRLVAVWASPATRYRRLAVRRERGLTPAQAAERDKAELENLNKGGPIAIADFTITNECSIEDLRRKAEKVVGKVR